MPEVVVQGGRIRQADILTLWENHICNHPDCNETQDLEIDHITPYCFGGKNEAGNLQLLCVTCHRKKTSKEASIRATNSWSQKTGRAGR